jgi:peptidase M50B-like protein
VAGGPRAGSRPAAPPGGRDLAAIRAELARAVRFDDESIVHSTWIRQRYASGGFPDYTAARRQAVRVAWHEAGHAAAALAVGARFSSVSIHHGRDSQGRVHGITGAGDLAFVIHAAGQIAERLMAWQTFASDAELRAWLAGWRGDGGDARHFRRAVGRGFGGDEARAWRYCEEVLVPWRPAIRQVARALLLHPRHLRFAVVSELAATS